METDEGQGDRLHDETVTLTVPDVAARSPSEAGFEKTARQS